LKVSDSTVTITGFKLKFEVLTELPIGSYTFEVALTTDITGA
jgi:hypothetical protein